MIVPYTRTIKQGSVGIDVLATKRALAHAHYRKWGYGFTKRAGARWAKDIRRFQSQHGLHVDGQYGPKTHAKLARYFDAYGARLMVLAHKRLSAQPAGKAAAVHAAITLYNNRYHCRYTQSGLRMMIVRSRIRDLAAWFRLGRTLYEDCSSSCTGYYYIARLADPNGRGYDGQGYTGTLAVHGVRVSSPLPGDLGLYGGFPYRHVVIYVGNGLCVSFGSNPPRLCTPHYRPDFSHWRRYA